MHERNCVICQRAYVAGSQRTRRRACDGAARRLAQVHGPVASAVLVVLNKWNSRSAQVLQAALPTNAADHSCIVRTRTCLPATKKFVAPEQKD